MADQTTPPNRRADPLEHTPIVRGYEPGVQTAGAAFGFTFEPPPGWTKTELPCAEADSLKQALAADSSLSGLELTEVWCLRTCNMIWASEGYFYSGPWRDEDWVDATAGI